jgi:hypothetical protein
MAKADSVLSTPPTNTSATTPKSSRRRFLVQAAGVAAGGATLGATLPLPTPSDAAERPDAELIELGARFEPLLDHYYLAHPRWSGSLARAQDEHDQEFGDPADRNYEYGVSLDRLYHGYLPEHPRLKPLKTLRRTAGQRGKQRRSKNGTPEERASNVAAAKARLRAPLMHEVDKHLAAKPSVADPSFVDFLRRLGGYVVQEFGTGNEVDQIFEELIADALVTYQKNRSEP